LENVGLDSIGLDSIGLENVGLDSVGSTAAADALEHGNESGHPATSSLNDAAAAWTTDLSALPNQPDFASPLRIRQDRRTPTPKRRIPVEIEHQFNVNSSSSSKSAKSNRGGPREPNRANPRFSATAAASITSVDSGAVANASSSSNDSVDGLKLDIVVLALNTLICQMDTLTETMSTFDGRLKGVEKAVLELKNVGGKNPVKHV